MQLDTETAAAILKSSAQCNAMAEEATLRVVELMQEAIEHRERIADLERAMLRMKIEATAILAFEEKDVTASLWRIVKIARETLGEANR
jgi:hypothetical protein